MTKSEAPKGERGRAKPQQEPRQRAHWNDRGQTTSNTAADKREVQQPGHSLQGSDFSQRTFERHAALLGDSRMSQPMYASQRALIVRQLQRDYGNRYVQRLVNHISRMPAEAVHLRRSIQGNHRSTGESRVPRVLKGTMGGTVSPRLGRG